MSFTSAEFVIFMGVVAPLYFWVAHRWRWPLLLAASYFFYAYGSVNYLPLLIFSTLVDYAAARQIASADRQGVRRAWLIASLSANLGVLFFFKYLDFFGESAQALTGLDYQPLGLILPVGISFYTFQSMSYTIDVYRGQMLPEKNIGIMATFVAFFPQLVAGPIERATHLLPQFRVRHRFDEARAVSGLRLVLWGFFKKMVIADRLAIYVNTVYGQPESYTGQTLIIAAIFFCFQIYCDFSGYSDIATGTARLMGFELMANFRQPYLARSVREFWGRWHISLSTWFRDYVYIPLGGNRRGIGRTMANLMIVFIVSGLWHGAGWTFVIWGTLHGAAVALDAGLRHRQMALFRFPAVIQMALTFGFICVAFIFFRADSLRDALYVTGHLLAFDWEADLTAPFAASILAPQLEFAISWGLIGLLLAADWLVERGRWSVLLHGSPRALRWAGYYALGAAVTLASIYGVGAQQFIYFRF